jgi:alpha-methylacyl-CoA racemase
MEKLGFSPKVCLERNPRLVFGRMTGWGQTGPLANVAGHDINYISVSGALSTFGEKGRAPVFPLNLVGDFGGGALYLVVGMLAGILSARKTGKGQVVDAAMVDGAASLMTHLYGFLGAGIWQEERGHNILDGGAHFYGVYQTKDDRYIGIGPIEEKFYLRLLKEVELSSDSDLIDGFMDKSRWPQLREKLAAKIKQKTRQEWCDQMEMLDACVSPVLSMKEAADHPHMRARKMFVEIDGVLQPAPAPRFSDSEPVVRSSPATKTDSSKVLEAWGFNADLTRDLKAAQAIG